MPPLPSDASDAVAACPPLPARRRVGPRPITHDIRRLAERSLEPPVSNPFLLEAYAFTEAIEQQVVEERRFLRG